MEKIVTLSGLRARPEFEKNPFMEEGIKDIKTVVRKQTVRATDGRDRGYEMIDEEKGVRSHTRFIRLIELDEKRFVKEYIQELKNYFSLSKQAENVYRYVKMKLERNNDWIIFNTRECMISAGYKTPKSVIDGVCELIDKKILAKTINSNIFYINPMILFNGDRVSFARTYVKQKEKDLANEVVVDLTTGEMMTTERAMNIPSDYLPATIGI